MTFSVSSDVAWCFWHSDSKRKTSIREARKQLLPVDESQADARITTGSLASASSIPFHYWQRAILLHAGPMVTYDAPGCSFRRLIASEDRPVHDAWPTYSFKDIFTAPKWLQARRPPGTNRRVEVEPITLVRQDVMDSTSRW